MKASMARRCAGLTALATWVTGGAGIAANTTVPDSELVDSFVSWASSNGQTVSAPACSTSSKSATCYGLLQDGGVLVASPDGGSGFTIVDPGRAVTPSTPTHEAAGVSGSGTYDAPYGIGQPGEIGDDTTITVTAFTPDGWPLLGESGQFFEHPPDGQTFAVVTVELAYHGDEPNHDLSELQFTLIAGGAQLDMDFNSFALPDAWDSMSSVFPGGTKKGSVGFVIPVEQASTAMFMVETAYFDGDEYYFATS